MARIAVIGGTGYAGRHIVAEAVSRGHTVVSVARNGARGADRGCHVLEGTLLDVPGLVAELQGVDVVVSAVAPRGDMVGKCGRRHRSSSRRSSRARVCASE